MKREIGEWVEEESEGSIPTSSPKKDLGVRAKSLKKSDLVRLFYLQFSYSTTPAVPHMAFVASLSEKSELFHYDFYSDTTPAVRTTIYS